MPAKATTVPRPSSAETCIRRAESTTGRYRRLSEKTPTPATRPTATVISPEGDAIRPAAPMRSSPVKGRQTRAAVARPAPSELRIRSGSGLPVLGASDRRRTTKPTTNPRMPSCIFVSAARTASAEAASRWSRCSSRRPSSRRIEPTESAWPHIALLNQVIGLTRTISATMKARRLLTPRSLTISQTTAASPRSANIGTTFTPSPMLPPVRKLTAPSNRRYTGG